MDTHNPSQPQSATTIEAGQQALEQGAWEEARSAFERALGASEPEGSAEILSGLAEAMWWLGAIQESLECWERAYSGFRRRPDPAQAASVAIQLGVLYDANLGNHAAAAGWVARAARLVDEHALEPLRGWVLLAKAADADSGQQEALAHRAHQLGRTSGDRHLELCALTQIGVALIDQGRITEGMTFHDEAMAGALAGEGELDTVVFAACEMMDSYSRCAQYQRMAQWIRAADRFVERYGCPYLNASCRTTASETENADLFWGIRGGGSNFGVVTTFEYRLHPVGPEVMAAAVMYPFGQATELLHAWRGYTEQAPDEVTSEILLWSIPDIPDFPEELCGEPTVVVAGMYAGPAEAGERELQPLREFGTPLVDLSGIQPYTAAQSDFDAFFPGGLLYYWKSLYLDHLDDGAINALVVHAENRPSPQTPLIVRHLGGAISRVPEEATAYGNRNTRFNLSIDATWEDPIQSERNIAWTREVWTKMRQFSEGGIYVNFAGFLEEGEKLLHEAHGENYERLVALKTKYDPTNLFRLNHNIKPSL